MASDYAFNTNVSLIALNRSGQEVAIGETKNEYIGGTFSIESNGANFALFKKESGDSDKIGKANAQKDRWYNYTIRVKHTATGKFNMKIFIDGRLAIQKDIVTTEINPSFDDLSGIVALQFGYDFWVVDIGKVSTYFDDVTAAVYNSDFDVPEMSGAKPKNEISCDDTSSNTALGISYFYTPPIENLDYSMSTVMFVNDKTTIADIKNGFTFGGKTWLESNAVVRDSEGNAVRDEALPIKNYYLALTDANGKNHYIKPYCGTVELKQTATSDKGMCEMLTEQSAHDRNGLEVIRQNQTKNEYIADNNLSEDEASTLTNTMLDNGKVFDICSSAQPIRSQYFPITVSGDFYMKLIGKTTTGVNVKYTDMDGRTCFWSIREISASDTCIHHYDPFYPNAWNKIAITIYPGTPYADFYVNGIYVRRYTAAKAIKEIQTVKMLLNTVPGTEYNDSKGAVYMDNFKMETGIYQIPEITERTMPQCVTTAYAQFLNDTHKMNLKQSITRGDLIKAIGNVDEFDGYGLFTDNAKTEINDDNYVIKNNDTLLIKYDDIWKYYRITFTSSIAIGKITMTQGGKEITDRKFSTGELNVSMPIVDANKEYKPVILIASYSGGELKNVAVNKCNDAISEGSVISGNAQIPENADNVVIYLWENIGVMNPVASCISLTKRD